LKKVMRSCILNTTLKGRI